MACAVRHCSSVGFAKSGKGEVLTCLDQVLYFAFVFFAGEFDLGLSLDLAVNPAGFPFFNLSHVFALRGFGVVVLAGFVIPLVVTLAAAERVDLLIMIEVHCR